MFYTPYLIWAAKFLTQMRNDNTTRTPKRRAVFVHEPGTSGAWVAANQHVEVLSSCDAARHYDVTHTHIYIKHRTNDLEIQRIWSE